VTEDAKRILALEESPALTAECGIQANKKAHVRVSDSI
jgi:hypothetical protein